ncbi:exosortase system-associated protein, TIGR04073 family [bacterium]|nr:exosortase system-associated protein, TIGR04073 family [bacterium]
MVSHAFRIRLLFSALILAAGLLFVPTQAHAEGPLYGSTYTSKISGKLVRGAANIGFCWCEVPIEINREIQNTDPFTGSFVGFGKGLWYTGRRLVLGVVDVVTFPIDLYGNNYQSIQRTDFPFIDEVE